MASAIINGDGSACTDGALSKAAIPVRECCYKMLVMAPYFPPLLPFLQHYPHPRIMFARLSGNDHQKDVSCFKFAYLSICFVEMLDVLLRLLCLGSKISGF